ncbi:mical [Culex quinquefasciatus]|uniref:Mical n=1 Tax=Culex quinquefasciatus TaxID=7176 RepID=B0X1S4_CULQU|nr:mical [Culex quinquefasciatus]|eukprot:XP_001863596.1 mical [Culex quinquefasciatus]
MEVIDENEWTDRNFGTESDESDEEMSSSDESDSDSDSDYEEAAGSPLGAQTLQLASEWISDKRFSNMVDSDDDFYGYSSEDDEADSQTEGEELARAREMRMQEVKLMPPPTLPTDTETEVPPKSVVEPPTTAVPQSNLNEPCTSSSTFGNNPPAPPVESAEEKAIREKMLQKLSVREQWLHSSTPSPPPQGPPTYGTAGANTTPVGTPPPSEPPKPKTSFFGGLMNSLSTLIKSDKQQSPPKPLQSPPKDSPPEVTPVVIPPSPSPSIRRLAQSSPKPPPSPTPSLRRQNQKQPEVPGSPTPSLKKHRKHKPATPSPTPSTASRVSSSGHPDDIEFEEVFKEDLKECNSSGRSTPQKQLKRRSRPKVREEGEDDFLEKIKQDQAALDRRMKKVDAQKFKSNMQSIKSAVEGPRIVGVKSEKDVSKFFTGAKVEAKPKQLPNKDVSALQGVNLAKYFPNANPAPTTSPKASATPSSVSSVEGSPMLTRKKSSEVDLMKYFGPSTAKSSPSTPSSLASPAISRKNSVESPVTVQKTTPKPTINLAPKPPVVPLPPKKNILAFQPIKKSSTESTIAPAPPSPGPTKNALAFQPVAGGKTPPSPKAAPKASSSPPKKTPTTRKSPDDDKLFDDLLKDIDKSPLSAKKLTKTSPPTKKKTSDDRVSPKPVKKSKPPTPKRRSPDLDEQLFEDLLGDVDDSVVENFEEIVGLPKPKQSPKPTKKKLSPKQSPKPVKKPTAPAVPKMTVKRPPFKITVPVKMQETLEEIYLASLSKLDTRSASSTSLNTIDTPIKSNSEHDLGKVDEAFEALLQEPTVTTVTEPIKNQPFQAPQRKRTSPPKQAGAESGAKATSETRTAERTVVSQVVPIAPATPKVTKKIVETPQSKLSNQTELKQAAESPKPAQKFPLKLKQAGSATSLDKVATVPKKVDTGSKPATPVVARKVTSSPVDKVAMSETATPILTRKNVTSEQLPTAGTPVLTRKPTNSNLPMAVTNGEVVPKSAPANKVVKEPPTPVASRKTDTATKPSTPIATKKIVSPAPGSATIVLAKNSSVSIEATPIATKTIDKTESVKPVSASSTPVLTKHDTAKEPQEPAIVAPTSPTEEPKLEEKPKQRKLSSDEVCFEELRKKHEAAFRGELEQAAAPVQELVDSKPVDVPRTLSEFRSSIICKPAPLRSAQQDGPASPVSDKINELVAEIMPGANLDDMIDDVPVPVERKKSSFAKMFHKLQRANTIAAMEASSLKPLAAKPNDEEYKIEVIRETPAKKESPQPDRMKINLERSAQIKEQYAKQKAPSPPKAAKVIPPTEVGRTGSFKIQSALPKEEPVQRQESAPVPAERRSPTKKQLPTTPKSLERTESLKVTAPIPMERRSPTKKQLPIAQIPVERTEPLKIKVVPVQKQESAPVPAERRSPTKKQLPATPKPLERTTSLKVNAESAQKLEPAPKPMERKSPKKQLPTLTKPLERTTSLRVTAEAPKLERKPFQLPTTPNDIDHQLSILSREPGSSANKPFVVDFDDLLDSVETTEVVSFDDLLSSDDEKPAKTIPRVAEQKLPAENMVMSVQTVPKVTEQTKPLLVQKIAVTPVVPKLPEQNKVVSAEKIATAPIKVTEKKLDASELIKPVAVQTSKIEQIAPKNPLSEKEFTQAAQQLTDKFLNAQPKKIQETPSEQKDLKAEAMMTVLTEATDISVKETDLFDSLCETLNQDSLISKSTTSLSTLPDLVSMTQKPTIEESKPLKVLDFTDKIKQIANHVPQEIQVYTLHTEEDKPAPQPSTSGVTNNYAHILKDITSGIVGSNLDMSVTYEPPPAIDRKPKSDFTTYKQMLQEKSHESPEPPSQQPQRPLRKPKPIERSVSPIVARPFDNSICVNPRRARKSPSIENIAIEQVFVKQDDKVIDTFYVVPEQSRQLKRRSKSYDRLEVPSSSKASARQAKHSLDELRDYGFDIEPPSTVKHLVNPRLRHLDFEGSDEELSSFREPKRFERVRKCNSTTDTSKLDVEATRVDIDRESPIPRSTDFSKWEAILDRGVPYYKEQKHQKKEDVKTLERKLEDLKVERKPRKRFPAKTTIPKDYDPQEYVPRINRRFEEPDSDLPKWYDPDEYVPKAQRGNPMYETEVPVSRSHRAYDMEVPTSRPQRVSAHEMEMPVSRPQRTSAHEMEVPISRVGGRYYHEPMHLEDYPVSHTLPRSKTATHIPYSSVSSRSHDLPSREITKTQYSRRANVDNSAIVSRSQRLHEKANKYIRSQISKNDPNPYIRELADTDDEDFHLPVPSSTAHRTPITTSSSYHHPMTSYGSSGSAAMSRITTKAITQPSRMTHYARKDAPSSAGASSYRRGGESSNRRDNCAIS